MAVHSLYCADVQLRNCSLTHGYSHVKTARNDVLHVSVSHWCNRVQWCLLACKWDAANNQI